MANSSNVYLRDGVFYFRMRAEGKRINRSLDTANIKEARARAKLLRSAVTQKRFDILDASKERRGYATLGRVFEVFRQGAKARQLRDETVGRYESCLGQLVRLDHPNVNVDQVSTSVLTRSLVKRWVASRLATVSDPEREQSIRRSIKTTVAQARAIFGKTWAREGFKEEGLVLPDLSDFLSAPTVRAQPTRYRLTAELRDLLRVTLEKGKEHQEKDAGLWLVFLLCYYLGLRANEAAHARWSWITKHDDGYNIDVVDRPGEWPGPKGSEGTVPIPSAVLAWLFEARRQGDEYILPGGSHTARYNLVTRDFAGWMRGIGWSPRKYPKAAHELRKFRGSEIFTAYGIEAAQAFLRHAEISVTKQYYADFTRRVPTLEIEQSGFGAVNVS